MDLLKKNINRGVEFWISLTLVITFVVMSMYLVLQIRDADRAEDREKVASLEFDTLNEKIPHQKLESRVLSEKITSLSTELAGLRENYEKLKSQYDKAEAVVSARNQASQEYSDLMARKGVIEKTIKGLQLERDQLFVALGDIRGKIKTEQQSVLILQQQKLTLASDTKDLVIKKRTLDLIKEETAKFEKEILLLKKKSVGLSGEIENEQSKILSFQNQLADAKSELTLLDVSIRNKKTDKTTLNSSITQLKSQIIDLEQKLRGMNGEYTTLLSLQRETAIEKAKKDQLKSIIKKLEMQKETENLALLDAKQKLSTVLVKIEQIKVREEKLNSKDARLGDLDAAISLRQAQLDELNKNISKSRTEFSKINAKASALGEREARVAERERQAATREEALRIKETQVESK